MAIKTKEQYESVNTPTAELPLALSYNSRDTLGYTNVITNAKDQRTINTIYEIVTNPSQQNVTMYLTKRPGVVLNANSYGATTQIGYIVYSPITNGDLWVFSESGNDIRVSNQTSTTVIFTSTGAYFPEFVTNVLNGTTINTILQIGLVNSTAQVIFVGTNLDTWTQITDVDFTGLSIRGKMEHIDGYTFVLDSSHRIYNSDLNSFTAWTANNFIVRQNVSDDPVSLARYKKLLMAFGDRSVDFFEVIGAPSGTGSPLKRVEGLDTDIGMVRLGNEANGSTNYYDIIDGKLYFIGSRSSGQRGGNDNFSLGVYSFDGKEFEKISESGIDKILEEARASETLTLQCVIGVPVHGQNAVAIGLNITTATTQNWLMYFPKTKSWHEWTSTIFTPMNFYGNFLGVGTNQHRLYSIDTANQWQDDATNYAFTHQFRLPVEKENEIKRMSMCGVVGDTSTTAQNLSVQWSDDDYQSFNTARTIDMTQTRKALYSCGSFTERVIRLTYTGSLPMRLSKFLYRLI